jgi:hypothetical protein
VVATPVLRLQARGGGGDVAVIQSETDPPCEHLLAGMGHLVGGEVERWWWEVVVLMVMVVASAGASHVVVLIPIIIDSQHGGRGVSGDVAGLWVLGAAYLAGIHLQESPSAPRWSPWSYEEAPSRVLHVLHVLRWHCSLLVVYILNISHIQLVSKLKQETKEKNIPMAQMTVVVVWAHVASKTVVCSHLQLLLVCGWHWEWREWVVMEWWW